MDPPGGLQRRRCAHRRVGRLRRGHIPPAGFTNAAFLAFGGRPTESGHPSPRYADGQNWDTAVYALPTATRKVVATLKYQTTSREYIDFLRDENTTNDAGLVLHDLWVAHGRAAPVDMTADSVLIGVSDVPGAPIVGNGAEVSLSPMTNPFRGNPALALELPGPAFVSWVGELRGGRAYPLIAWVTRFAIEARRAASIARYRRPSLTREADTGAGLGLSISRGLAKDHGGRLGVSSPRRGGAVIDSILPVPGIASERQQDQAA